LIRSDELLVKVTLYGFNPITLGFAITFGILDTFSFKQELTLTTVLDVFNAGFPFEAADVVVRFKLKNILIFIIK